MTEHIADRRVATVHTPSGSGSGLLGNLRRLGRYRDLLYTLTLHRIAVRYKQSALGALWSVVQPLSLMLIYTLVFSLIARMPSEGTPYAIFTYTALLPWSFFSTALSTATSGLVGNSALVSKVYFPREILPLTYVFASLVDFTIASSVMAGLLIFYDIALTPNALYVVPIMGVLTVFVTAMSLVLSALQVRFRDVTMAMPLLLQLWMFATPIIYPLSAVPERLLGVYTLNPMVGLIDNFRRVVLHGEAPDLGLLGTSALVSTLLLVVCYSFFKRVEATLADVI